MEVAKRVTKNTFILYFRMILTVFISLWTTRLILSALGQSDFGLFNLIAGIISTLGFINGSITNSTQRFMSFHHGEGDRDVINRVFNVSLLLHLASGVMTALMLEIAAYFMFDRVLSISPDKIEQARLLFHLSLTGVVFSILFTPYDAVIISRENMKIYSIVSVIESLVKLGIALALQHIENDRLLYYGMLMIATPFISSLIKIVYCRKRYPECRIHFRRAVDKKLLGSMTSFSGWSFLGSMSSLAANYGQAIVVNTFFDTKVNAAQGVTNELSGKLGALANTMLKALNPLIAKSEGSGDRKMMVQAAMLGSKFGFFLLMILYAPAILEMPYILRLWLGDYPAHTVEFCRLHLLRELLQQMFLTLTTAIYAVGHIKIFEVFNAVTNLSQIAVAGLLFYLGFPPESLYIDYLIFTGINALGILWFSRIKFHLSVLEFIRKVVCRNVIVLGLCLLMADIPEYYMDPGYPRLITVLGVGGFSALVLIWRVGLARDERKQAAQLVNETLRSVFARYAKKRNA